MTENRESKKTEFKATLTTNGRLTVPIEELRFLDAKPGDQLHIIAWKTGVYEEPKKKELRGSKK